MNRPMKTPEQLASNRCIQCYAEFSEANPCCCDTVIVTVDGIDKHLDGVCVRCCDHTKYLWYRDHNW